MDHSGHCRGCKERVRDLLKAIYGECRVSPSFPWPSKPEAYSNTATGEALLRISKRLEELRGHQDFIKHPQIPPCDFYVPDSAFILEFDESQHFTSARYASLCLYPHNEKFGFSVERWKDLCLLVNAVDDKPPDRDERRAWYDTLRDLLPPLYGFHPTVRIYAEEFHWCALDSGLKRDQDIFCSFLKERLP